jgi:hypothetical protein
MLSPHLKSTSIQQPISDPLVSIQDQKWEDQLTLADLMKQKKQKQKSPNVIKTQAEPSQRITPRVSKKFVFGKDNS